MKPKKKQAPSLTQQDIKRLKKTRLAHRSIYLLWSGRRYESAEGWRRMAFVFGGKQGKGEKKAMIVEVGDHFGAYNVIAPTWANWVYWPKPSEALRFALARKHLVPGGYADTFLGSVGTVSGSFGISRSFADKAIYKTLIINNMQGNFSQNTSGLSRSLVSRHGGWRQHIMGCIFQQCLVKGVKRVSFMPKSEIQMKIFLEAAEKNGFEFETPLEKKLGNLLSAKLKGAKL